MTFVKLNQTQLENKLSFIDNYKRDINPATASTVDANANVSTKNVATLEAEINKDINIQINRALITEKLEELYGKEMADEYIRQLESHEIYKHDEGSFIKPYCVSTSLYPFLLHGTTHLGGDSKAPKNIYAYCGSFVNLVFAIASQFAGAVATVEFLLYFDHFARKQFGEGYMKNLGPIEKDLTQLFQHVVYSLNQPASARGFQSVFWNISIFDKHFYESLFGNFYFPDGTQGNWESLDLLQKFFMKWFNKERTRAVLTFPVVTVAMLVDDEKPVSQDFEKFISKELSEGNSFFIYQSKTVDSLASCCRLRNELMDNTFSYSLGAGGVQTGSISVITINFNRLIQDGRNLKEQVEKIHKYHTAYRAVMDDFYKAKLLPVYDAGFIKLDKQFLTIGINGMVEGAEFKGLTIGDNKEYKDFVAEQLKIIYETNKEGRAKYGLMFNTEFVPAENLGVKNSKWDRKDGYVVARDCYNSYFFVVEDEEINIIDKFVLHGRDLLKYLDGGSALHLNLGEYLDEEQYKNLLRVSARTGCNYFTTNVKITICNKCNNIDKRTLERCPKCASEDIDYGTRVIGYLKRVSAFSNARQEEEGVRLYHNNK